MRKNRLTIGLIIPYYQRMFSTFYTLEIIKEVSRAASRLDIDLLIDTTWRVSDISGILFVDIVGNELLVKKARKKTIPYIILNYYDKNSVDSCIGIDNEKASFEAVNYLVCAGHKRIATITGKLNVQAGIQRLNGYKRALTEKNLSVENRYIVQGDWTRASGRRAMRKLLVLNKRPTAVFVSGDEMALGAIDTIRADGLEVPQDVSLIGFDNIPEVASGAENLSTIKQPFSELAELGLDYIVKIVRKRLKHPLKILLRSTELIKRGSVKDLRKRERKRIGV